MDSRISPVAEDQKLIYIFIVQKKEEMDVLLVGEMDQINLLNSTTEPISFTFTKTTNWCRT